MRRLPPVLPRLAPAAARAEDLHVATRVRGRRLFQATKGPDRARLNPRTQIYLRALQFGPEVFLRADQRR